MRFVNCTNFIVSALLISRAFELKFSLIVYVIIVIISNPDLTLYDSEM